MPGLDWDCFKEAAGREKYAAVARKLDEVASLSRAEVDTSAMESDQNDIDEMIALTGDVENDYASRY